MRKLWVAALCAAGVMALSAPRAMAEVVTVSFDITNIDVGAVAATEFGLSQGVQSFAGTWTYDNTNVVSGLFLTAAPLSFIQSFELTVGAVTFDKSSIRSGSDTPWIGFDTHGALDLFVFDLGSTGASAVVGGALDGGGFNFSTPDNSTFCSGCVSFTSSPDQSSLRSGGPEPASWALMITGFGMAGGALRRRRAVPA